MDRPEPVAAARDLVSHRCPDALALDPARLEGLAEEVLEPLGGRLWVRFRRGTTLS